MLHVHATCTCINVLSQSYFVGKLYVFVQRVDVHGYHVCLFKIE